MPKNIRQKIGYFYFSNIPKVTTRISAESVNVEDLQRLTNQKLGEIYPSPFICLFLRPFFDSVDISVLWYFYTIFEIIAWPFLRNELVFEFVKNNSFSTPAPKPYTPGKRGRPPKNPIIVPAESDEKEKKLDNGQEKRTASPSENSPKDESSIVITEKRRRGRPRKTEKTDEGGKWSDVSTKNTGKFDLPLPVPESWPLVTNMEEIMTELAEMYSNVKVEKRGEFHNQIKAFVFALHWV
ncbi:hypothetical protein Y032_0030g2127 [Ancylostoma ceylanicum]|uniref:Uncharacterized protein n=1 Tax=Ancylostoma ceylanicum TaxID=53326 RepID=A0A016USW8_9BILA|nr:hypothetical protein Y032_0030g2127 [Ancylostoma ceylanicum]